MVRQYTVKADLEHKQFDTSVRGVKAQINALEREGKALTNAFKVTGDFSKLNGSMSALAKGSGMAKAQVQELQTKLASASAQKLPAEEIVKMQNELIRARTQAERFDASLAQVGSMKKSGGNFLQKASDGAKSFGSNLLDVGSKIGNIATGAMAMASTVTGAIERVGGVVGGYANTLMSTYDDQVKSQKTLTAVLTDGAKGYEVFNSHINKGSQLLKSQKNDLNQIGATLASYTQMSGEKAFQLANSINAVGDSLSTSTDEQKQFALAVAQAMGAGALHAQDFNQMMQTALGANYKQLLIDAANQGNSWGTVTQANFKDAMEAGVFSTDVMNRALDGFIQQGQKVASEGPSTFEQVKAMITNGFNTSSLEGFKSTLSSAGFDFSVFGNSAGTIASDVGNNIGKMAGRVANDMLKYIDANNDGKVSNEELGAMSDKISGKIDDFFRKINSQDVSGFVSGMGDAIRAIGDVIGWIKDAISWINDLNSWLDSTFSKKQMMDNIAAAGGHGGGSGGGRNWLVSGFGMDGLAGDLVTPQEKIFGAMSKALPLNAQLFAGAGTASTGIVSALANARNVSPSSGFNAGSKTIIFNQTLNGSKAEDGGKDEIIRILKKNGYNIKFTS